MSKITWGGGATSAAVAAQIDIPNDGGDW